MQIELRYLENGMVECRYKEVHLVLWDILKYTVNHPYLKHYLIKNYEGGNTIIPREAWKHEETLIYKELSFGVYYFPYESLGFVLNDSVSSLTLYAFEESFTDYPDEQKADLMIEIRETDKVRLVFHSSFLSLFLGFYTLSVLKIGFEDVTVTHLAEIFASIVDKEKPSFWEPVLGSVSITPQGLQFLVETLEKGEEVYYRFTYKTKCKKERLKPQEVKSVALTFKKKILVTRKDKFFFFIGLVLLLWLGFVVLKNKIMMPWMVMSVLAYVVWYLLKKFYLVWFSRRMAR